MKALVCELCGSNAIVEQDGLFVCQHCGTKHVVEEKFKKKHTSRKKDMRDELDNLLKLGRKAVRENDAPNVIGYFKEYFKKSVEYMEKIDYRPIDWDAHFYYEYYSILAQPIKNLEDRDYWVTGVSFVFEGLKSARLPNDELIKNATVVVNGYIEMANHLYDSAKRIYLSSEPEGNYKAFKTLTFRCSKVRDLFYEIGDVITDDYYPFYRDERLVGLAVGAWKDGVNIHIEVNNSNVLDVDLELVQSYITKILNYDKSYIPPALIRKTHSKGCYIATCVYGSYDCPEVWVLRRFRDNVLARNIFGKAFINVYYAISPKLVKAFGKSSLFRNLCQNPLDILVGFLRKNGFKDTPYKD